MEAVIYRFVSIVSQRVAFCCARRILSGHKFTTTFFRNQITFFIHQVEDLADKAMTTFVTVLFLTAIVMAVCPVWVRELCVSHFILCFDHLLIRLFNRKLLFGRRSKARSGQISKKPRTRKQQAMPIRLRWSVILQTNKAYYKCV
jgi:hypothetical protein